eukprot:gene31947-38627_t
MIFLRTNFLIIFLLFAWFVAQLAQAWRLGRMCKTQHRLSMSASSLDYFHPVQLVANTQEAEGLRFVTVQVPEPIAAGYVKAGQYVKVRNSKDASNTQKPSFFAIASPPDQRGVLSFLIKETPNNEALFQNSGLEMSLPLGNGFNIEESFEVYKHDFPVNRIFMFCTGAGIAPIASVLDSQVLGLGKTSFTSLVPRTAVLYYGVRTPAHLAFQKRWAEWEEKGVQVIPVISQPNGYVQDHIRLPIPTSSNPNPVPATPTPLSAPRNAGVLLCGQGAMTGEVKGMCLEGGVFEGRILFNY